jgi:hypothetical protein
MLLTPLVMATLNLYIVTFNCGLALIDTQAVASQILKGVDGALPDLIVISLQEIAPISSSFIGGSFLVPQFERVENAVNLAAKERGNAGEYKAVVARNVGMTALMVLAKDPASIEAIESAEVGLGAKEMGNKGAVGVRLLYRDVEAGANASTELTFVAAHLAAMEPEIERRNEDWKNIVRGLVFSSNPQERKGDATSLSAAADQDDQPLLSTSPQAAGIYKPTSHLFIAGDLNYRTSILKPGPNDYAETFPQPYNSPDSPQHYSKLFEGDQLNQERQAGRTCHGLIESPVTFPPTYKYEEEGPFLVSDDEIEKWNWASHRWPSWCDRILYLDIPTWLSKPYPEARIIPHRYIALPLFPTSDHRAVVQSFTIPLIPIPIPDEEYDDSSDPRIKPPFNIDPDWRAKRQQARKLEFFAGLLAYFTATWEGGALMLATLGGVVGGFFMLRAAIDF